jgi:hypothetical protein
MGYAWLMVCEGNRPSEQQMLSLQALRTMPLEAQIKAMLTNGTACSSACLSC